MQRKPGFSAANCSVKGPDAVAEMEPPAADDADRLKHYINFGNAQWGGWANWSWRVTKQEVDFIDFSNNKYCVGVAAYVAVTVNYTNINTVRENVGYATCMANQKGSAIHKARKCAVTNALKESLLSFGDTIATEFERIQNKNHQNQVANLKRGTSDPSTTATLPIEVPNTALNPQPSGSRPLPCGTIVAPGTNVVPATNVATETNMAPVTNVSGIPVAKGTNMAPITNVVPGIPVATGTHMAPGTNAAPLKIQPPALPTAKALPMPANLPPPNRTPAPRPQAPRPNSNEAAAVVVPALEEEAARAERKRRQRLAQEEFLRKRSEKENRTNEPSIGISAADKDSTSSFDSLLLDLQTQDIDIEQTGPEAESKMDAKRKSPSHDSASKRRGTFSNKLDIINK